MIATLVAVTAAAGALGVAVAARHRAQAAADLGALAAATALPAGQPVACERAGAVTRAASVNLVGCTAEGSDVVVAVEVTVGIGRWGIGVAAAVARAGPAAPRS